jgi:hypothetical protein
MSTRVVNKLKAVMRPGLGSFSVSPGMLESKSLMAVLVVFVTVIAFVLVFVGTSLGEP